MLLTPVPVTPLPSDGDPLLDALRQATIGRYEIHAELGRGGMAAVYLAHDLSLKRSVAIKVMLPGLRNVPTMSERFIAEATTAARLQHPNIVVIHHVDESTLVSYFVMSHIEGLAVSDLVKRVGRLQFDIVAWIIGQTSRALVHAHFEEVVHRDVKPSNIMITSKGDVVVIDFGIAKASTSPEITLTGTVPGTPAYSSPEQVLGRKVGPSSDQYSLGVMAYGLLSGHPPFDGSVAEIQYGHAHLPVPRSPELEASATPIVVDCVMRMLAKDPERRYEMLEEVRGIFDMALGDRREAARSALAELVQQFVGRRNSRTSSPTPVTPIEAIGSYPSRELVVGTSLQLDDFDGFDGRAQVTTSDPRVALVRPNGVLEALAPGACIVRVTSGRQSFGIRLTVKRRGPVPVRLVVSPAVLEVREGDVVSLPSVSAFSADGASVDMVDERRVSAAPEGLVRVDTRLWKLQALSAGEAAVVVGVGDLTADMRVRVRPRAVPVGAVSATPQRATLRVGEEVQLRVIVADALGGPISGAALTFGSRLARVATVAADGTIRAVAVGLCDVTVTCEGVTVTVPVEVGLRAARLAISPRSLNLEVGQSARMHVDLRNSSGDAIDLPVSWDFPAKLCTVSPDGGVVARANGRGVVRATVGDLHASSDIVIGTAKTGPVAQATARMRTIGVALGVGLLLLAGAALTWTLARQHAAVRLLSSAAVNDVTKVGLRLTGRGFIPAAGDVLAPGWEMTSGGQIIATAQSVRVSPVLSFWRVADGAFASHFEITVLDDEPERLFGLFIECRSASDGRIRNNYLFVTLSPGDVRLDRLDGREWRHPIPPTPVAALRGTAARLDLIVTETEARLFVNGNQSRKLSLECRPTGTTGLAAITGSKFVFERVGFVELREK